MSVSEATTASRPVLRLGAWAGIVGPTLFVATFFLEGWLRPDYESARMFVSALSLGPRGGIQIVNFLVVGTSFLMFSRAVAVQFPEGKASRAGPVLLALIGLGLFGSGPFVMDPGTALFPQMSLHSQVHNLLGAVVFSLGPVCCFVFARRFREDPAWHSMRGWTLAAGITMTVAVVLLKVAMLPPPASPNALSPWVGVIQRVAIVSLMSWVASVGVAMLKHGAVEGCP